MNRPLKKYLLALFVFFSFEASVNSQQTFIDSIRSMLVDLDTSVQFARINALVKKTIPICTGTSINDQLADALRLLMTEDYIYATGLQQAVSPHLITRYSKFLAKIAESIRDARGNSENVMLGVALLHASTEKENVHLLEKARTLFIQPSYTHSYSSAERLYYLAKTYASNYKSDSCYMLMKQSLECNPIKTVDENVLYAKTLYFLGNYCYGLNKHDSAFKLFRDNLVLRKKIHGERSSEYAYWMIVTADH